MILDTIVARKKAEVEALKKGGIELPGEFAGHPVDPVRGFRQALVEAAGVAVIAEVKKASPSKGVIRPDFDPVAIARNYERRGARAVSVLTDADFFQGSLTDLMQVRAAIDLPVLRKDFLVDPIQIDEARAHGADAILLIAAILDRYQIEDFRATAAAHGIDSLVEVHDEAELDLALAAGADLIGINNRDLRDFSVDLGTTLRLRRLIPADIPVVSESGIASTADIRALAEAGVSAALIGESLMRAGSASDLLERLRGGGEGRL